VSLDDVPMIFILVGLIFYVVLAGPDFGAAIWQVSAPRDERGERLRDLAHDAMGPVWEANHVWLIFVLTVMWTSYPVAFGSIASTLCVALFLAGLGIVVRGAAYALRAGTHTLREQVRIDDASAISSVLTPFALGAAVGSGWSLARPRTSLLAAPTPGKLTREPSPMRERVSQNHSLARRPGFPWSQQHVRRRLRPQPALDGLLRQGRAANHAAATMGPLPHHHLGLCEAADRRPGAVELGARGRQRPREDARQ